ncbi:MAG: helix-turn-helix transcriptional regulator [Eubacteriales bacterium]|nr:helix-turn-helix transcriptional regulator [Eubacteriales bacterium]
MKISYKPLMRQLLERDMGKMDLLRAASLSTTTLSKLGKNQPVKLEMLMKICTVLHCRIEDVVEFVEE